MHYDEADKVGSKMVIDSIRLAPQQNIRNNAMLVEIAQATRYKVSMVKSDIAVNIGPCFYFKFGYGGRVVIAVVISLDVIDNVNNRTSLF